MRFLPVKILPVVVALLLWAGVADAQTLVRTGQMWGTDKSDGKVAATLGIAGECVQTGNDLACQFVSLSLSADGKCSVLVSTWKENLRGVSRTRDEARWSGTSGPMGMAGVLTTTVLIAKRHLFMNKETDYFNQPGYGPGPVDEWSYRSTAVHTAKVFKKVQPPTVTEVVSWTAQPKFCRPTEAMLMAISPAAAD